MGELLGMIVVENEEDTDWFVVVIAVSLDLLLLFSDLLWIDTAVPLDKYMQLKPYQVICYYYYLFIIIIIADS